MGTRFLARTAAVVALSAVAGCTAAPPAADTPEVWYERTGPLVAASTTMVTAWEIPQNPLADAVLDDSPLSEQVRWGYRLFTNTPEEAPHLSGGQMSCSNCHLNAGQRELALPLVGVAAMFPEYNGRAGRLFSLPDRIVGCFWRSQNATGVAEGHPPDASTPEVLALTAYLTWLSRDRAIGDNPTWRKRNRIPAEVRLPLEQLDPRIGEALFMEHCTNCHGEDGQGVQIGDKKAGPLWGPDSWNDGAGAARIYTLAGIIRYMMPYLDPGRLTDEEAQQVAAFITSKPRPVYPYKDDDYLSSSVPIDAVYYPDVTARRASPAD